MAWRIYKNDIGLTRHYYSALVPGCLWLTECLAYVKERKDGSADLYVRRTTFFKDRGFDKHRQKRFANPSLAVQEIQRLLRQETQDKDNS